MSWISTTWLALAATPREYGVLPSTGWSAMASRPISAKPVLVPIAVGVRAGMSGLSERRAAATGWLLIAAATGMAVPAYVQTLSLGEIAVGKAAAPLYALLAVAPAVILTAAGLLARWSHPGSRIGVEDVPLVVELRDGGPMSELSQAGVAATSGAAVARVE
jgi:hypothetical protein